MNLIHKLGRRLKVLLAHGAVERDMQEEMESHLAESVREFERQGLTREEAWRRARIAFGGVEAAKENARDAWGGRLSRDLLADLRHGFRQAVRAPFHTIAIVGLLGIAIAGASLAFALARAYLIRPLPVPAADRLMSVLPTPVRGQWQNIPDLSDVDWAAGAALFEQTASWDLDGFTLVGNGRPPEPALGAWVTPGYFELLNVRPALGRGFSAEEYVPGSTVALISDKIWRSRFNADPGVVGSSIRLHSTDRPDEEALVTIVGVMEPVRWELNRFTEVLRPLGTNRMFYLARLPQGVTPEDAAARLTGTVRAQIQVADSSWAMSLRSTQAEYVHDIRPVLTVLVGAALLLLLLALASTGALLLARATARFRELNVRQALGASRGRLIRQLATEAGLLGGLAFVLGVGLTPVLARGAALGLQTFGRVAVPGGAETVGLDPPVLLALFVVTALPFMLLALSPLFRLTAQDESGLARGTPPRSVVGMRRALSTLQVSVAVVLLSQGALLFQSIRSMLTADLGFESRNLLKAHTLLPREHYPDSTSQVIAVERMLDRVRQVPGVLDAAVVNPHPFRLAQTQAVECEGCASGGLLLRAMPTVVSTSYFAAMGVPLVSGRVFDERDVAGSEPVAMVSESLGRRLWNGEDVVGRRLRIGEGEDAGPWVSVIGVVGEVRKTYGDSVIPDVYRPYAQDPRAFTAVMVRTSSDPTALERPIREAVARETEALALGEVETMDGVLRDRRGPAQVLATFVGGVAVLAFGLTVLGLAAVVGYLVRLRRREFAVRVALGARPAQIVGVVFGEARGMLGLGLALGLALAWAAAGVSRAALVGVSPRDPLTYAAVAGIVVTVALAALMVPARIAAGVDPTIGLRED